MDRRRAPRPVPALAVAAASTAEIELGTAIAVAFARFSMEWSRPAARMREMVRAVRTIWDAWQHGTRLRFEGEFYQHTLMTPMFTPKPSDLGDFGPRHLRLTGTAGSEMAPMPSQDSPLAAGVAGVLLAHGAGGGAGHRTLVALEDSLEVPVHRMEFGYRGQGRRFPDRAPKLIAEVRAGAEAFAADLDTTTARLVLGGRSMGGRMCSMAVAEGLPAAGLVLLSYPMHPPGKPDRLRVEHFSNIDVPVLFVNGDRDPFGTPAEFEAHIGDIPGDVTVRWLERQGHDPKPSADAEIVAAVGAFLAAL